MVGSRRRNLWLGWYWLDSTINIMAPLSSQQLVAQFGNKPAPINTPTGGSSSAAPANGAAPITTADLVSQNKPKKTLVGKALTGIGNFFTGGVQKFGKTFGEAVDAPAQEKNYQDALTTWGTVNNNLLAHEKELSSAGADTTKLKATIADHAKNKPTLQQFTGSVINKTGGQVAGEALGAATDIIGGLGMADVGADVVKGSVKAAVKEGAATGAGYGGAGALSQSLEKKQTPVDTAINTAEGTAIGGGLGAILGGASAKVKDLISPTEESIANKAKALEKKTMDFVQPTLTKGKAADAIAAGQGTIKKGTIFDKVGLKFPNLEKAVKKVGDLIDTAKTKTENIINLRSSIGSEAEKLVSDIAAHDHPVTFKELSSKLNDVELPISFKNDKTQAKTLKDITTAFMKIVKEKGGKVSSVLSARKDFDNLVEENFPKLYEEGKPTTAYYAITKVRNAVNDFIGKELPEGFGYQDSLDKQTAMYNVIDAMKADAGAEVDNITNQGIRAVKAFAKKHPITTKVVGSAAGTLLGAEAAKKLGIIP